MKKILLIILLFCCNKFILVAQQVTSSLTLVTTDLMTTEVRNQFSWSNVQYTLLRFYQLPSKAVDIMVDPGDELGGSSGGNNGGGSIVYCKVPGWSGRTEWGNVSGVITLCYICNDLSRDCQGELVAVQPTGGSGNNNEPFNWGNLGWGNLGGYFQTGFLNPPANGPIGGFGINSGYGGGATPNPKGNTTIVPPPTNPTDVDEPTGGSSAAQQQKDSIVYDTIPCNDTIAKRIGRRLDKDLQDCRNASYKVDSLYKYTLNATSGTPEAGITFGTDDLSNSIIVSSIFSNNDTALVLLPFSSNYTTDKDLHTHFEDGWYFPNIVDIYSLLIKTAVRDTGVVTASYITCQDGSLFAITPTDRDAIDLFLATYNKLDNVDRYNTKRFGFKEGSVLESDFFAPFAISAYKAGINKQDAFTYAMAYLISSTQMGIGLYKANSINEPFKKINAEMFTNTTTNKTTLIITKCN